MMPLKKEHRIFVEEMVKHGDRIKAYRIAYPKAKADATAKVNATRLLTNATISTAIKEKSQKIEAIATNKAAEELKDKIVANVATAMEKREILLRIMRGELEIDVKKPVWDREQGKWVFVPMKEKPDHSTRMKAIDLDNKMAGDYAPEKKDLNLNGSFLDFLMSTD